MSYCEKLEAWAKKEWEERGLVDVKFFPLFIQLPGMHEPVHCLLPEEKISTVEELVKGYLEMMTSTDYVDVTEVDL